MEIAAAIFLALAILIGVIMTGYLFQNKEIPKGLPMIHGSFAGVGIILLIVYAFTTDDQTKNWNLIMVFLLAAVGGLYLFEKDITHQKVPKGIAIIHALTALGGFIWLIIYLVS